MKPPTQHETHRSPIESRWQPAGVETARIVNVNVDDWSVDCVGEYGNKKFFDLQVMAPYFHYTNGEGFYIQPEVGAMVWICRPSMGRFAAPFVLGFQTPFDEDVGSFRSGKQTLNPGDMMMRTRDENFLVLRRGGVVQIGATPICQTIYVPINNIIRHFCEKFEINAFGGQLLWETHRRETSSEEDMLTTLYLNVKERADDPKHIAELSIGSHGEDNPLTMKLVIFTDGTNDRGPQITMEMTSEGNVFWSLENEWHLTAAKDIFVESLEESFTLKVAKNVNMEAGENIEIKVADRNNLECDRSRIQADTSHVVKCDDIKHGSASATEPGVLGKELETILKDICTVINNLTYLDTTAVGPVGPAPVIGCKAIGAVKGTISNMLAQKVKLE